MSRFEVDVADRNPWTHLNALDQPENFSFALLADRSGGIREGHLERVIDRVNWLQPAFALHIGDLIEGAPHDMGEVNAQWDEALDVVAPLEPPLFLVPGNHDTVSLEQAEVWKERFGKIYYHFIYQNVLFLVLYSEDPPPKQMSGEQLAYFERVLEEHPEVRWTMVFIHVPLWRYDPDRNGWEEFEKLLEGRRYTVFAGHVHRYLKDVRNGESYIIVACSGAWNPSRGPEVGEFDHITWVTMTDNGPLITNINTEGIYNEDVHTLTMEAFLDPVRWGEIVTSSGLWCQGAAFERGECTLRLRNPLDRPIDLELLIHPTRQVRTGVMTLERTLAAGEVEEISIPCAAIHPVPLHEADPLRVEWHFQCSWPNREPIRMSGIHRINIDGIQDCPRRTFDITVDGDLREWGDLRWRCVEPGQVQQCPDWWSGPADASFDFDLAWDDDYVYVAVRAYDDVVRHRGRKEPWRKDGLIIRLDARPDGERQLPQEAWMNPEANSEFARSFGTHPGPGVFEKYLYIGLALGATADEFTVYESERLPEGVLCACKPCDGGYSAEVAVPAAWFDAQQGKPWEKFRFNVTLIDYDDSYAAPYTALWWRPEWNHAENYPDSGTFRRG